MAALKVQSLASVSASSHCLTLLPERSSRLQCAGSGSKSTRSVSVNKKFSLRRNPRVLQRNAQLVVCEGSKQSGELEGKSLSKNVDLSHIILNSSSDLDLLEISSNTEVSKKNGDNSATRQPKFSTLRAFGEGGAVVVSGLEGSVFELLAANIQATADLRRFEILSGRLAMLAFFVAIGVEGVSGNAFFKGIDVKELGQFAAFAGLATVTAAGFAFAWRARSSVGSSLSKGALQLVDTAIDKVIDGLFYDEEEKFK